MTPYIVLYSMGYRTDFAEMKITATGGIYVRAMPQGVNVTIDSKISNKTGIFSNSVFVKNLLPKEHNVLVAKDGYHDYKKNFWVKENQVTKLENIILFKKETSFEVLSGGREEFSLLLKTPPDKFFIKNGNLYYSEIQENSNLTAKQKKEPVIKSLVAYRVSGNSIIWLGFDGVLKSSDLTGQNTQEVSQTALKTNPKKSYRLNNLGQKTFLLEGDDLLLFDKESESFQNFHTPVKNLKISPDGQKIVYFNDYEIFVYYLDENLSPDGKNKILLQKHNEKISDFQWLNSDYIVFSKANEIIISEIDARGDVNAIKLPQTVLLSSGKNIEIRGPELFFDQQDNKLYILAQNTILASEKLIP